AGRRQAVKTGWHLHAVTAVALTVQAGLDSRSTGFAFLRCDWLLPFSGLRTGTALIVLLPESLRCFPCWPCWPVLVRPARVALLAVVFAVPPSPSVRPAPRADLQVRQLTRESLGDRPFQTSENQVRHLAAGFRRPVRHPVVHVDP